MNAEQLIRTYILVIVYIVDVRWNVCFMYCSFLCFIMFGSSFSDLCRNTMHAVSYLHTYIKQHVVCDITEIYYSFCYMCDICMMCS